MTNCILVIAGVVILIAVFLLSALMLQGIWNYLLASFFHAPDISFKVAVGLTLLWMFLSGGSRTVYVRER